MLTINNKYKAEIMQVCKITSNTATNPIYKYVRLSISQDGILTIKGSDSVSMLSRMIVVDNFDDQVDFCVDAKKLSAIANACNGDIKILRKDGSVVISSDKKRFTLPTIPSELFNIVCLGDQVKIECDNFIENIKSASWASADKNEVRHMLKGIHINNGHTVATDGISMTVIDNNIGNEISAIIPSSAVLSIPEFDSYDVYLTNNALIIKSQDCEFTTLLVDARYPDYKRVIQVPTKYATVNVDSLIDAVKSANITSDDKKQQVTLCFDEQSKVISSDTDGKCSEVDFICHERTCDFEFTANSKFLTGVLNHIESVDVQLGFSDHNQMIVKEDGKTSILMGVKR